MKKIVLFAVLAFLIAWWMLGRYLGNELRENHTLTQGIVTSVSKVSNKGRKGPSIKINYKRKNELITATIRKTQLKYSIDNFVGKSFPVVYRWNGLWYDDNILITPNDFSSFGYPFPDSLKWVLEYIEKR